MLDLFGSKKKAILALPQFQDILATVKDLKAIIRGMSNEFCIVQVSPKIHPSETHIALEFSAMIENQALRYWLNEYYDKLYISRPYAFHYDYTKHSHLTSEELQQLYQKYDGAEKGLRNNYLDTICDLLFCDDASRALYERYKDFGYTDIDSIVYDGFGIPKRYISSDNPQIPFTRSFSFQTGLSEYFPNGKFKPDATQQDEINYYAQILLSQI